jgi:hypothetical protein
MGDDLGERVVLARDPARERSRSIELDRSDENAAARRDPSRPRRQADSKGVAE